MSGVRKIVDIFEYSPADAIILAILASRVGNPNEIHYALMSAQALEHAMKVGVIIANHDRLRVIKNCIDILDHEFRNMRNMIQDEVPVCSDQASYTNIFVINSKIIAFPDKSFDDFDHRALSQVVSPGLKTEA